LNSGVCADREGRKEVVIRIKTMLTINGNLELWGIIDINKVLLFKSSPEMMKMWSREIV